MFSIVTEARDQTLPGSLLARETLGTRLQFTSQIHNNVSNPARDNSYLSAKAYAHKIKGFYDPTKSFLI